MELFGKLIRFIGSSCVLGLRRGPSAVLEDIFATLRYRLGIDALTARTHAMEQRINGIEQKIDGMQQTISGMISTWTATSWIEQAELKETPLVSVVLPTHERSAWLRRAVDSVTAQTYSRWEIVLVDDGSTDDTPAVTQELRNRLGEDRVRIVRIANSGVCAARNHGLAAARGELIAYLDDDNVMHPLWLKAVVWGFSQRPDVDVVYGGIIIDDTRRVNREGVGDLPSYHLHPYDRRRLVEFNLADIGAVAHRSGLPEARFDEGLREMGDWDLLARLTRHKAPLMIPAVACFYYTTAPDRLSGGPTYHADAARVREKAR
jgi:glycosyltransferase involved in cell wall biosynthesis